MALARIGILPATLLILVLCAGCLTKDPKECNLVELQKTHPELYQAFTNYPDLFMDMFKRITVLEREAGGYQ